MTISERVKHGSKSFYNADYWYRVENAGTQSDLLSNVF